MNRPEPSSFAGSDRHDWLELRLPEIRPDAGPIEHAAPTDAQAIAHAMILLKSVPDAVWRQRRRDMNPERFVMD